MAIQNRKYWRKWTINKNVTMAGTLAVAGAVSLTGSISAAGMTLTNNAGIGGSLSVTGGQSGSTLTLSSTLAVTGPSTLTGALAANGGVTVPKGKQLDVAGKVNTSGAAATLSAGAGTYNLDGIAASADTSVKIAVDGVAAVEVTFQAADFANYAACTAAELVSLINAALGAVIASDNAGTLVLTSTTDGKDSALDVDAGTTNDANSVLSFSTSPVAGTASVNIEDDASVVGDVTVSGSVTVGTAITHAGSAGALLELKTKTVEVTGLSGASGTAAGFIPANCVLVGLCARVTTLITSGDGATTFELGISGDADRWGTTIAFGAGTLVEAADWTSGTVAGTPYAAAADVIIAASANTFSAGAVRLVIWYYDITAPTA